MHKPEPVDRVVLDHAATARLRHNVVDLCAILLSQQGYNVERLDDGIRRATSLEVVDGRARVVVHVEVVIA